MIPSLGTTILVVEVILGASHVPLTMSVWDGTCCGRKRLYTLCRASASNYTSSLSGPYATPYISIYPSIVRHLYPLLIIGTRGAPCDATSVSTRFVGISTKTIQDHSRPLSAQISPDVSSGT